ncbi:hypothetical protein [Stenotrophomonas phage BUCTxx99]|nr:hypothetical protein [Stenotrophomonas phage BUCTxx99]
MAVDLPFFIVEVMHFYGWNWQQIMQTPIKLFWTLLKQMYRLQAQEALRWIRILSVPNLTEDARKSFIDEQVKALGTIQVMDERDEDGINKLKNLS